jgi:hypothetical protein
MSLAGSSKLAKEIWKPVVGFEIGYEVSTLGRLRRAGPDNMGRITHVGKIIKPMRGSRDYLIYSLWKDRKPHSKLIHRLVMEAFIGPREGMYTNHKNGIKTDNRLVNLEYVTQSENYLHAIHTLGFQPANGEKQWKSKISDAQVYEICSRLARGEKVTALSREFGIAQGSVSLFKQGKSRAISCGFTNAKTAQN